MVNNFLTITAIHCPDDKVYDPCAPACQPSCGEMGLCNSDGCIETCRCPDGKVMEGDRCVDPSECGCTLPFVGLYLPVSIYIQYKQGSKGSNYPRCYRQLLTPCLKA